MKPLFWTLQYLLLLVTGLWLGWTLLALVDFAFPLAYHWLDIRGHIDTFGPQNRYRPGYHTLDEAAHFSHFAAIVDAIHQRGRGLEAIVYATPDGRTHTLLRAPEVLHLQDVSRLVDLWRWCGAGAATAWLTGLAWLGAKGWQPPSPYRVAVGTCSITLAATAVILVIGPVEVFYAAHRVVFPPGHEWFFYYQDSLMTTLMKAPDLFGFITVLWILLTGPLLWGGVKAQGIMARRRNGVP
jgi:hypothetical protein